MSKVIPRKFQLITHSHKVTIRLFYISAHKISSMIKFSYCGENFKKTETTQNGIDSIYKTTHDITKKDNYYVDMLT